MEPIGVQSTFQAPGHTSLLAILVQESKASWRDSVVNLLYEEYTTYIPMLVGLGKGFVSSLLESHKQISLLIK
jgi:hypothetical protein